MTYAAYNRYGELVRTFNALDLAEAYRDRMAAINTIITIKPLRAPARRAA